MCLKHSKKLSNLWILHTVTVFNTLGPLAYMYSYAKLNQSFMSGY